jgi:hypothetical protein
MQLLLVVMQYYKKLEPTPFDQMNLCLDGILLKPTPKSVGVFLEHDHMLAEQMLITVLDVCTEILEMLEKHNQSY